MTSKVNTTLSIDEDVKLAFKISCLMNNVDMSETVENFMHEYAINTKKLRDERESRKES